MITYIFCYKNARSLIYTIFNGSIIVKNILGTMLVRGVRGIVRASNSRNSSFLQGLFGGSGIYNYI